MAFTVCGEALIDLTTAPAPDDSRFRSTWHALSAGGPMNTAVALARLGGDVQFLGRLSSDAFGRQLTAHLQQHRVGLDRAVQTEDPTSVAVVSLDDAGKAGYAFHFEGTANFGWRPEELPDLERGDWLHFGSLLSVVPPGAPVVLEWLQRCPARLSYDINVRPSVIADAREYWQAVEPWLATVGRSGGIVKASDDDLAFLAPAAGAGAGPVELARSWVERHGLAMFVLTLGPDGAAAVLPGGEVVTVPGYPVEVVDTVGAGDTFMAGFLTAHHDAPEEVVEALRHGVAASAIVCGRQGAQPPTLAEVREHLARHHPDLVPGR